MGIIQNRQIPFGKRSGLNVYPVSIGAMRLPEDEQQAIALLRQAIDANMVYIDTSRGYGDSEIKVGKALKDGYRQKVILSTKWSPWVKKIASDDDTSAECAYRRLCESMERLDVDYLDFYQIWSVHSLESWKEATQKGGMLEGIQRAKDEGLVGHIGFTTHDTPENVSRYIDEADWCEAILFTYNMLNPTYKEVIAKAHEKGIATTVMNPVAGGMFAEGSDVLDGAVKTAVDIEDPIEAAHRYLKGDENVDMIICGIAKPSDITSTLANYQKPGLTAEQRTSIEMEMAKLTGESKGFCTQCKYCMPCPAKINIPGMMQVVYYDKFLQTPKKAKEDFGWLILPENGCHCAPPTECTECGQCEQKCTQKLNIIEQMKDLAKKYCKDNKD
jgi:uncharacterized protein